jgi:carbon storage regulator
MLVLSRKLNEAIRIGGDISIRVVRIDRDTVRLGVSAPKDIGVHREEVYLEIVENNIAAAESAIGLAILVEVTGFASMALFISRLGTVPVAGHQIAANLDLLLPLHLRQFVHGRFSRALQTRHVGASA